MRRLLTELDVNARALIIWYAPDEWSARKFLIVYHRLTTRLPR